MWYSEISMQIFGICSSKHKHILLKCANFYLNCLPTYIWDIPSIIFFFAWGEKSLLLCVVLVWRFNVPRPTLTHLTNPGEFLLLCFVELFGSYHIKTPEAEILDPNDVFFFSVHYLQGMVLQICPCQATLPSLLCGLTAWAFTFCPEVGMFFPSQYPRCIVSVESPV